MMKIHEIWLDCNGLHGLCLSGENGDSFRRLLDQPAKIVHKFNANCHYDAMKYYHKYLRREEYPTDYPDLDMIPYEQIAQQDDAPERFAPGDL